MLSNKYIQAEEESYFAPFVDLMSGVVFILMIILSNEIMNIKYGTDLNSSQLSVSKEGQDVINFKKIELFKKKLLQSISNYLKKNDIANIVSKDNNYIVIYNHTLFDKEGLSFVKEGNYIANKISEAFNQNLFMYEEESKKHIDYISSITIDIFSSLEKKSTSSPISKSFVFYGYLVNINPMFLSFSNSYNQRLIRISDTRSIPESFLKYLKKYKKDILIIKFNFDYHENSCLLW